MGNNIITICPADFGKMTATAAAKLEKVYFCDFYREYHKYVYVGNFVCANLNTAARRMSKIIGFDINRLEYVLSGKDKSFYMIDSVTFPNGKTGYTVYVNLKIDGFAPVPMYDLMGNDRPYFNTITAAIHECAQNELMSSNIDVYIIDEYGARIYIDLWHITDARKIAAETETATETETETETAPADISTLQRAAVIEILRAAVIADGAPADFTPVLTYSPTATAAAATKGITAAIYSTNAAATVTKTDDNYYVKFTNGNNYAVYSYFDDKGNICTYAYKDDIDSTDSGTTYDSARAHSYSAPALYDSDKQTLRFDKKQTADSGRKTYKVNSTTAAAVATAYGKTAGANGDYTAPAPAPYSDSEREFFEHLRQRQRARTIDEIRAATVNKWEYVKPTYSKTPFTEICGGVIISDNNYAVKTYHIFNDFSPFGMLFNAVIIARGTNRIKLDKMGKNGGGTIIKQLIDRDVKLSAIFGKMCAFYGYNKNSHFETVTIPRPLKYNGTITPAPVNIYVRKNAIDDKTPAEIDSFITEIYAMLNDSTAHYEKTDSDGQTETDSDGRTKTDTLTDSGTNSDKESYDIVDIALTTLYTYGAPITAQSRYNAARAVNAYLSKSVKEYKNRVNADKTDDSGEIIPFGIADIALYADFLHKEYNELQSINENDFVDLSVNFDIWYDYLTDVHKEFCTALLENGGEMRGEKCGRGDKCGLRTVADKMGISYKVARRYEKEIKDSFNARFTLPTAYQYKHNFDYMTAGVIAHFAQMRKTGAKCTIDYNVHTVPTAPAPAPLMGINNRTIARIFDDMTAARPYCNTNFMRAILDSADSFKTARAAYIDNCYKSMLEWA